MRGAISRCTTMSPGFAACAKAGPAKPAADRPARPARPPMTVSRVASRGAPIVLIALIARLHSVPHEAIMLYVPDYQIWSAKQSALISFVCNVVLPCYFLW
ncbi:hypothetical protein BCAR13_800112 [Paraburkholderia caribensis]|nr:hypothetical protein BCAR13_800112 [Paraburkholderia caribensis]